MGPCHHCGCLASALHRAADHDVDVFLTECRGKSVRLHFTERTQRRISPIFMDELIGNRVRLLRMTTEGDTRDALDSDEKGSTNSERWLGWCRWGLDRHAVSTTVMVPVEPSRSTSVPVGSL